MMPVIRISDTNHRKLQKLAIPLVDNPDTLIGRLIDAAFEGVPYKIPNLNEETKPAVTALQVSATIMDDIHNHPNLTHTKMREASFGGVDLTKANWSNLVKHAHEAAYRQLGSFQALRNASHTRIRQGRYTGNGFSYLENIDVSIQGQDANQSWENALRIARRLGVPIRVSFEWYSKQGADRPGESDSLAWEPE